MHTTAVSSNPPDKRELLRRLREKRKGGELKTYPLSFAQERLWFLDRLEPESPFYALPMVLRLRGGLDAEVLWRTFHEIVRRHQVLRTRIVSVGGRPAQVVEKTARLATPRVDLSALSPSAVEREVERQSRGEVRRPFDLGRGPLLRLVLFHVAPDHHVLILNLHHIAGDGWSLGILMREVKAVYEAFVPSGGSRGGDFAEGRPVPLEELPIQYADFATWQRKWLESEDSQRQLDYWQNQLAGAPPLLELPTDRPRPAVQTYRGAVVSRALSAALSRRVETLARQEKTTVFALLLAGFDALIGRHTGRGDVVVGTAVSNRSRPEVEGLIGFFVNTLVLRTDLSGEPGFRRLLERSRKVVLDAYAHQDLPFERLVEALQPVRELAYSPIFQVMLVLQNTPLERSSIADLGFESLNFGTGTAQFDLSLNFMEGPDGLAATWHYNVDLFDDTSVARLAVHFGHLLEAAVEDPDRPVSRLPLESRAEHQQVLLEWNDTAVATSAEELVHRLFERQARRSPSAPAVSFGERSLSYEELDARADRLAHHLVDHGAVPGSVVGLYLGRDADTVTAILAVLKAGAAYLPLDPAYPRERLELMIEDARVSLVVTHGGEGGELAARRVDLDHDRRAIEARPASPPEVEVDGGDLAYVIYTSGSTGRPKGVMVPHATVVNFFAGMDGRLLGAEPGTWLALTSISFDISVLELLWTLTRGFHTVVQGERSASAVASRSSAAVREMQFSLFYFASDHQGVDDPYRLLLDGARFADQHGFTAVWTPERHFHAFGGLYPNPSVAGAALAAVTEHVEIRAGSVVLPLHHPVRVAEEWSLVDNLSKGRVAISFASGWHANDFVFAPGNYAERKAHMFREIETVRRLWRGESVELEGGAGNPVEVVIHPRPVQAELPFWITAGGNPETFRSAGEIGANLLTHLLGQSTEDLAEKIRIYRQAFREAGHGPGQGHVTLMLHTFVGESLDEVLAVVREPFLGYLRSSGGLLANLARSLGRSDRVDELSDEEQRLLLEVAFDRYFETSGLMGTLDSCAEMVESLRAVGVDEIGCLIDFGVEYETAMAGLERLDELRRTVNEAKPARGRAAASSAAASSAAASAAEAFERWDVSHLQCTPSTAAVMLADAATASALAALDQLMLGGEALPSELARRLRELTGAEIHNMYGPTETTIWSTTARVPGDETPIRIGRPIANTRIQLLDPGFRPVPVGAAGQLVIGGAGVVRGYLDRPATTAEKFLPDATGAAGERVYATGDLARRNGGGELEFLGRIDHQVKISGYRIELGEIEAVLRRHPDLRDVAVASRVGQGGAVQLVAWVVAERRQVIAPAAPVDDAERTRLLDGRSSFDLPNGMTVTAYDGYQASELYNEIFVDQCYLRHGITYRDGDCIFDVGANAGFFTLFASHVCRPSKVYAFEPVPDTHELLRVNTALHGCPVETFRCGVAEAPGTAEFVFYPNASGLSGRAFDVEQDRREQRAFARQGLDSALDSDQLGRLGPEEIEAALDERLRQERIECPLVTVSDVIRDHGVERIDLLKVDAEKSEVHVLEGISEDDWPKVRQVVLEVHSRELLAGTRAILEKQGFHVAVDELMSIEGGGDGAELYVYLVFARRREDNGAERPQTQTLSFSRLRAFLREQLPEYMVPSIFVPLDELPLTPNGKVDKKALPEPRAVRRSAVARYVAPRTETEQRLAAIWQKLLRVEKVGLEDNFFEIGGTSLLLVQAHQRLRRDLGAEVSLVEMFRHPTIGSMADFLGGEQAQPAAVEQSRERARKQAEATQGSAARERQRQFLERRRQRRHRPRA